MIDLHDKNICPTLDEIGQYVRNPVFMQFCSAIKSAHSCSEKIEFSACSWEHGWNIKFKRRVKHCARYIRGKIM